MAVYRFRPPCPACGSVKVRCLKYGATDDDMPVRLRRCDECGGKFTTVEVISPVTFYRLDSARKWSNRMRMRERRGYAGGLGPKGKPAPLLRVKVSVVERVA
jgi:hypothetical protein